MAIKGDTTGKVTIPPITFTGAFSLSGSFTYSTAAGNTYVLYSSNSHFVAIASGVFRAKVAGTFIDGSWSFTEDEIINWTLVRDASNNVTLTANGVSSTVKVAAGNFTLSEIGRAFTKVIRSTLDMSGDGVNSRSYDTDDYTLPTDTILVDTLDGQNGTLTGYTTGGFVVDTAGNIVITSIADYQCITHDENGEAVFPIAGTYSGSPDTIVLSMNGGVDFVVLDASPTGDGFSANVRVKGQVDIIVAFGNDKSINAEVIYITAAWTMGRPGQSNTSSRGGELQVPSFSRNKPLPIMWKDGVFQPLTDPTNGYDNNSAGSTDARLASLFANAGVPICIGNVAQGGQGYSQWQKTGSLYPRLQAFADAVGGTLSACAGIGGENDEGDGQATIEANLNAFINDVKADFGCGYNLTKYPTISGDTLLAFNAVLASNPNALPGGDLSVMDISSATDPRNDDLHIILTPDLNQAAQIQYDDINTSTANLTAPGIPDGTYHTRLVESGTDRILHDGDLVWSNNNTSVLIDAPKSTTVSGHVIDNLEASIDGSALEAITA